MSLVDPSCKDEGARRLDKIEELPKMLAALLQLPFAAHGHGIAEGDEAEEGYAQEAATAATEAPAGYAPVEFIYVRVLRPSGPTYTVLELPGLSPDDGEDADPEYEAEIREILARHPSYLLLALVPAPDLFDRARSVLVAKEVRLFFLGGGTVCTCSQTCTEERGRRLLAC